MKNYELVIFDLDGTILDTGKGIFSAIKKAVSVFGYRELSDAELKSFVGPPIGQSFRRAFGLNDEQTTEIVTVFRKFYTDGDIFIAEPYSGIYDLFSSLKERGVKLAVATLKHEVAAKMLIEKFKFNVDIVCGSDAEGHISKPDIIKKCLCLAQVNCASKAVLIGDTVNDAAGARDSGVDFIAVTYGYGFKSKADLNDMPYIDCVNSVSEIKSILCE